MLTGKGGRGALQLSELLHRNLILGQPCKELTEGKSLKSGEHLGSWPGLEAMGILTTVKRRSLRSAWIYTPHINMCNLKYKLL